MPPPNRLLIRNSPPAVRQQRATGSGGGARIATVSAVLVYIFCFIDIYVNWATNLFFYIGFTHDQTSTHLFLAIGAAAVYSIFLPTAISKYSQFACWVIYLSVYIPSVLSLGLQSYVSFDPHQVIGVLFASFALLVFVSNKTPRHASAAQPPRSTTRGKASGAFEILKSATQSGVNRIQTSPLRFYIGVAALQIALTIYYIIVYRDILTFSGLDDLYDQRARFGGFQSDTLGSYLTGWLPNALNPFLIVAGLQDRRARLLVPIGLASQIVVYMAFAGKVILVIPIILILFYFFVYTKGTLSAFRIALGFCGTILIVESILLYSNYTPDGWMASLSGLIYMRTLAIQGVMMGVYADVFTSLPHTYYSHVNLVRLFVDYPFDAPLGVVVGRHLVGGLGFNANANFWATDGIAAAGLIGLPIVSTILGVILNLANGLITAERLAFAACVSMPFLMSLGNTSLFSSVLTGGGGMILLLIYFGAPKTVAPRDFSPAVRRPTPSASK
ncbi:MAG: hypothetical protein ABL907_02385 [Hyphomicrobium sp.]